jgi:hypothetical protein
VFDRGVDADPDRQTRIVRGMARPGSTHLSQAAMSMNELSEVTN